MDRLNHIFQKGFFFLPGHFFIYRLINGYKRRKKNHRLGNILKKSSPIKVNETNNKNHAKRILITTVTGGHFYAALLESVIAHALRLRGCQVDVLLCDQVLDACLMKQYGQFDISNTPSPVDKFKCRRCSYEGERIFRGIGIQPVKFSQFVSPDQINEIEELVSQIPLDTIPTYTYHGYRLGEHAYAGALRYFARADLIGEKEGEKILRAYLKSGLITAKVIEEITSHNSYSSSCFHHGIYIPHGIIGEVLRKKNIPVVNWVVAYKRQTYIFSHYDTYHHTMISEDTSVWENIDFDSEKENQITSYLYNRRFGKNDWIYFHDNPEEDFIEISKSLHIDPEKPFVLLLTNVMWDAQLHYSSNAFPNMLEWVYGTIDYFSKREDIQLIIRIHPAEIRGAVKSRQLLYDEIIKRFPSIPDNIVIVKPDNNISSYTLAENSNAVLIYNTKMGIEVACMGKPVIVAGEAWIRGKGFSQDANSEEEYYSFLYVLPFNGDIDSEKVIKAKKYAYHFFFRRMIPINFIKTRKSDMTDLFLDIPDLRVLGKGGDEGLDIICEGIINKTPFIYGDK